ncbi:MAG: flagellar hook-basal body complex protein FliE [Myxococcales bacterium]|nr:flagellar hook-basal body complex protein FliE [Myxococcales bacterium]MCA9566245.1 flagellar hook-basal body complex protein FliE [Myxococcales bacterium]MCB9690957.1 flagellar hook-basal body complex protein FliE [Alphaproteobacteria bacterium]
MLQAISALQTGLAQASVLPNESHGDPEAFGQLVAGAVDGVEKSQKDASHLLDLLASGEDVDLHGTMIEIEKADISLRAMASIRTRAIGAYEAVMNMAI